MLTYRGSRDATILLFLNVRGASEHRNKSIQDQQGEYKCKDEYDMKFYKTRKIP
jgi:hypothetical protein